MRSNIKPTMYLLSDLQFQRSKTVCFKVLILKNTEINFLNFIMDKPFECRA